MNYLEIREKYSKFLYKSYSYQFEGNMMVLKFEYQIEGLDSFSHQIKIEMVKENISHFNKSFLDNFVFNIGMFESISYYKITCSKEFEVVCYHLNSDQIKFFHNFFIKGLGELFSRNNIDFTSLHFLKIYSTSESGKEFKLLESSEPKMFDENILVPVGGGKDSGTVLGILDKENKKYSTLMVKPHSQFQNTLKLLSVSNSNKNILVERIFDMEKIKKLNADGFINGHVPVTAILSIISVFVARLFDFKYVCMANSVSSDEATEIFLGQEVNHQWSKSYEFQKDFRQYLDKFVTKEIGYFSLIRPIFELQVIKIFSKFKKYHKLFQSCNKGKDNGWCCNCSKCLFVYMGMYSFLSHEEMIDIFGEDLLSKKSLEEDFRKLVGLLPVKPYDCVGTRDENQVSANLAYRKYKKEGKVIPYLLKIFEEKIGKEGIPNEDMLEFLEKDVLRGFKEDHFIPESFIKILLKYLSLENQIG